MAKRFPNLFYRWFKQQGWTLRAYQREMLSAVSSHRSTLLVAPTGAGKTLSGFLPSLADLYKHPRSGLHTLYISPLKALTNDIHRNLTTPVAEMSLPISIETRTGDTSSYKRQRQRKKPPNILLTTPESLMLLLSYSDGATFFKNLHSVIIDEVHSLVGNKRGDFTALALARLNEIAPQHRRIGLSATVADPKGISRWLGVTGEPAQVVHVPQITQPDVTLLAPTQRMPFGGFMAGYAMEAVYQAIKKTKTALVFVNTRAQAERVFQMLWEQNRDGLAIALYHGALAKEQRRKTEALMAENKLRAIVSTSALELGIDWGNIDLVIQVGAPKGISRLLQRIGRANHRLDEPSQALLVPANRFEAIECKAAIEAIAKGKLDAETLTPGALDVLPQFIVNCVCSGPTTRDQVYEQVVNAPPYQDVTKAEFDRLWRFAANGGEALNGYGRFLRMTVDEGGFFRPASQRVIQRHRQNIGTIVEAGRLKVKRITRGNRGTIVGDVDEYFAQQLVPGDTFLFAGEVLKFEAIRDMQLHGKPAKSKDPKIPRYTGGQLSLSTFLADEVRGILKNPNSWATLPLQVQQWLQLQRAFSTLPSNDNILVEQFPYRKANQVLFYTFEGRKANQTLGMLMTRRMEKKGLKPLSFSATDYGLSVAMLETLDKRMLNTLFQPDILGDELEDWMLHAPMLKRSFRQVAVVSGLTEQRYHSRSKTMKQITFSTDLIYDTLREHDPDHILLTVTRMDAERELLDLRRLADMLIRFHDKLVFQDLPKVSPLAIPMVQALGSESITGAGAHELIAQAELYKEAESMLDEVRALLGGD
ncbi:ligase-associated DNA damage response DEXH box helicase [Alteromonas sp. C1M14]|uniref:ligase-associated DNA damage response DEXH box helicase n=1 Tax=Alteromonas sp. C1M14 TaxID=2841567 RepID=UPI001C08C842|nr:ligase-associated DNA damage response DEXH box helicase [Alteromonas sp. C1M14]MBU2980148.1 ligase-associated DNA damage response DEXH box helicase [Alteromonas sp. C1M14]